MAIIWQPIGGGLSVPTTEYGRFTEDAVELARFSAATTADTVCDLGAGSGIIPLLMCRRHPPRSIAAVEREETFAQMIQQAVDRFALTDTVTVYPADWSDETAMPPAHSMSLVTCNPPYFRYGASRPSADPLVRAARHEDRPDLLDTVFSAAARLLTEQGRVCVCHRPDRLADVFAAIERVGLCARRLQTVQASPEADPSLVLVEAARHGALRVLPTRIQQAVGTHTDVYKKLYR